MQNTDDFGETFEQILVEKAKFNPPVSNFNATAWQILDFMNLKSCLQL